MSSAYSPIFPSLHLSHSSLSNPSVGLSTSQLILQLFRCFTYVTAHSPTLLSPLLRHSRTHSPSFPSLHLRHTSFSNPSLAVPTSQLILQPFRCFTYVTAHSPTLLLLHLRHSSFSNPSFASLTSPGEPPIAQRHVFHRKLRNRGCSFTPTFPSLHLRHSSFSNPSVASPTSQLIL